MLGGTMVHKYFLEREDFGNKYAVMPDIEGLKKTQIVLDTSDDYKAQLKSMFLSTGGKKQELIDRLIQAKPEMKNYIWDHIVAQTVGSKEIITKTDLDRLTSLGTGLDAHPKLKSVFSREGFNEVKGWFIHPDFDVVITMTADRIYKDNAERFHVLDIKTAPSARIDKFIRKVEDEWLMVQAAIYFDGFSAIFMKEHGKPMSSFQWAVVQANGVPVWNHFKLNDAGLEVGQRIYWKKTMVFQECVASNVWPGYSDKVEDLAPSSFFFGKIDRIIEGDFYE